jgi:hypothetical protein
VARVRCREPRIDAPGESAVAHLVLCRSLAALSAACVEPLMTIQNESKADYVIRDSILKLLSDDEIARVSTAETAAHLQDGEEYLDLEQLQQGVRRAITRPTPMGRVLPRRAVDDQTWTRILSHLAAHRTGG